MKLSTKSRRSRQPEATCTVRASGVRVKGDGDTDDSACEPYSQITPGSIPDYVHLFGLLDRIYQVRALRSQIDPSVKGGPILWLWDVQVLSGS